MPASKHMVVIEKRRDIELRLLMSDGARQHARDSRPRKTVKRVRTALSRGTSATLSPETKP